MVWSRVNMNGQGRLSVHEIARLWRAFRRAVEDSAAPEQEQVFTGLRDMAHELLETKVAVGVRAGMARASAIVLVKGGAEVDYMDVAESAERVAALCAEADDLETALWRACDAILV